MIIFYDSRCTDYSRVGHPERPERIGATVPLLQAQHRDWRWQTPEPATEEMLLRAHSRAHLDLVENATQDFDADTAAHPRIYEYAARATGAAVAAARAAREGERAFSLMRPPGHHATRDRAMGFCYFNHIAVAAVEVLESGIGFQPMSIGSSARCRCHRVAIWDFDAHHGNGTEEIMADNSRIAFASVHQFPGYPGTGMRSFGNVHNFPIAPQTPRATHVAEVRRALDQLLTFQPDVLLVSAGFDAYIGDPITDMTLVADDFATFGRWLRECEVPAAAILEGGYSDALPELIDAFLSSWNS